MENIERKLDEIISWLKIIGRIELSIYLQEIISKDDELLLYQESDGIKTVKKLNELTGISTGKISLCWKKWEKLGILKKESSGRGKRLFDLEELGVIK